MATVTMIASTMIGLRSGSVLTASLFVGGDVVVTCDGTVGAVGCVVTGARVKDSELGRPDTCGVGAVVVVWTELSGRTVAPEAASTRKLDQTGTLENQSNPRVTISPRPNGMTAPTAQLSAEYTAVAPRGRVLALTPKMLDESVRNAGPAANADRVPRNAGFSAHCRAVCGGSHGSRLRPKTVLTHVTSLHSVVTGSPIRLQKWGPCGNPACTATRRPPLLTVVRRAEVTVEGMSVKRLLRSCSGTTVTGDDHAVGLVTLEKTERVTPPVVNADRVSPSSAGSPYTGLLKKATDWASVDVASRSPTPAVSTTGRAIPVKVRGLRLDMIEFVKEIRLLWSAVVNFREITRLAASVATLSVVTTRQC